MTISDIPDNQQPTGEDASAESPEATSVSTSLPPNQGPPFAPVEEVPTIGSAKTPTAKPCYIRNGNTKRHVFCGPSDVLTELDAVGLSVIQNSDGNLGLYLTGNVIKINSSTARALAAELIRLADIGPAFAHNGEEEKVCITIDPSAIE